MSGKQKKEIVNNDTRQEKLEEFEKRLTEHVKKKAGTEKLKKELETFSEDAQEKLPEAKIAGPENALRQEISKAEKENRDELIEACSVVAREEIPNEDVAVVIGRVKDFAQKSGVTLVAEEDPEALVKREKISQIRMLAKEIKIKSEEGNIEELVEKLKVLAEQNNIDLAKETDIIPEELGNYKRRGYISEAIELLKKSQKI
ncbi:MAG: hypothetical protein ABH919_02670 [bacterium]